VTPELIATSSIIFYLIVYGLLCWTHPFRRCPHCKGTGTRTTWLLKRITACRWCHGAGLRLRLGRRIYNHLRHIRRDTTTTQGTRLRQQHHDRVGQS